MKKPPILWNDCAACNIKLQWKNIGFLTSCSVNQLFSCVFCCAFCLLWGTCEMSENQINNTAVIRSTGKQYFLNYYCALLNVCIQTVCGVKDKTAGFYSFKNIIVNLSGSHMFEIIHWYLQYKLIFCKVLLAFIQ